MPPDPRGHPAPLPASGGSGGAAVVELAVSCRGLTKVYEEGGTSTVALRGVDLDARTGELLLLVGPSGCGKTTLLSLVAGILDPTAGEVHVLGAPMHALSAAEKTEFRRKNVGFIFQQYNLLPTLTSAENVAVPLLIQGMPRRRAVEAARAELAEVGLGDRGDTLPRNLSGGQQQRVAIARALVAHPRLIVCDEPTANLDGETGGKVMALLKKVAVARERCVLLVTHDARVFRYGDRIAEMLDGRIVAMHDDPKEMTHA